MPRCRFVDPTSERRIALSDDDWIVVRPELSVGQQREMYHAMRDGDGKVDLARYPAARALAHLVAWSLVDFQGAAAPVSAGALDQLDAATFAEITSALDTLDDAVDAEKKRIPIGASASDRILSSVA